MGWVGRWKMVMRGGEKRELGVKRDGKNHIIGKEVVEKEKV